MRRSAKLDREWWRARLAAAPAMAIAGIFIGVSGLMSVTFGYSLGTASGTGLLIAAFAVAVEGFADLSVPLFWRRLGLLGRAMLLVFFVMCLGYKLEAAKKFAAENLGKREAAAATAAQAFEIAQEKVQRLRRTLADNAIAREAALIQSEIDGLLRDPKADGCAGRINGEVTARVCPKVDGLRAELARATARDQAQKDLPDALAEWGRAAPGAGAAEASVGPVAWALALVGVQVGSGAMLLANLIMMICEAGAIVVPMLIGFAFGDGRKPVPKSEASAPAQGRKPDDAESAGSAAAPAPSLPTGLTERVRRDIADVTSFLAAAAEHAAGERVQSTALYLEYSQWKAARGEKPMIMQNFGGVLTKHLAMAKLKSDGKNWYLGIRLRHPLQGRGGTRHLRALAA